MRFLIPVLLALAAATMLAAGCSKPAPPPEASTPEAKAAVAAYDPAKSGTGSSVGASKTKSGSGVGGYSPAATGGKSSGN